MKHKVAFAVLFAALAGPAAAQNVPLDKESFRQQAMMADAFEIAASRLAVERSQNPRVRNYARRMINDHRETSQALNSGAAVYGSSGEVLGGTVAGGLIGAGIGALAGGPIGAAVGAGIGAATGAVTSAPRVSGDATGAVSAQTGVPLDTRKSAMLTQLASARGAKFDRLYGQAARSVHQELLALYSSYAQYGRDPAMVAYAQSVVPHLREHLSEARRLP